MSTSVIEREPGGAKRRSTLKGTARKVAMVGVGVSMLGPGLLFSSNLASATPSDGGEELVTICAKEEVGFSTTLVKIDALIQKPDFTVKAAFSQAIFPTLTGGTSTGQYKWLKDGPAYVNVNLQGDQTIYGNGCKDPRTDLVTFCSPGGESALYTKKTAAINSMMTAAGVLQGEFATSPNSVYPATPYGIIIPPLAIANFPYLTSAFGGSNYTAGATGGEYIFNQNCAIVAVPTPGPTVTTPGTNTTTTNTVTVPGPTVTVTATPTPTASAVPPVAIAPVVTPSATPSRVPPVAVAPVTAAVPTAVNAGDGSSQNRPMSPVSIVLLALAGVGVLYAALRLSTRRRSSSSQ